MAPSESWLTKMKAAISAVRRPANHSNDTNRVESVGILALEICSIMSKLMQLWRSLSNTQTSRLRNETIADPGLRRLISDDTSFLLGLVCAELTESVRLIADAVSALGNRCSVSSGLQEFNNKFKSFYDSGRDDCRWMLTAKEMEVRVKKMNRCIVENDQLLSEMNVLAEAELALQKQQMCCKDKRSVSAHKLVMDQQQKIFWQRQQVKYMKQTSLWSWSMDSAVLILAQSSFTVLARIKNVFSNGIDCNPQPRRQSVSAVIYPSLVSAAVARKSFSDKIEVYSDALFETNSMVLVPPPSTLGAAALELRYANIIKVLDKMIRTPSAVGADARDDLYSMLTCSVRGQLRERLRGVVWASAAADVGLAAEWRAALGRIMEWLLPAAQNTISWLGERSIERRSAASTTASMRCCVLLVQTLFFADRVKVEAAITELLVGLNYLCRFEREMSEWRKFDCLYVN